MQRYAQVLCALTAAAVAAPPAYAGHTLVELFQFFGDPIVQSPLDPAPTSFTANNRFTNPNVTLQQGDTNKRIYFPIFMELFAGDGNPGLLAAGFEVFKTGNLVASNSGNESAVPFTTTCNHLPAVPGDGSPHPTGGIGTLFRDTQFDFKCAAPPGLFDGTHYLGFMAVDVDPAATAGQESAYYFSIPTQGEFTFVFNTTMATLNTIAFGADEGNVEGDGDGMNAWRLQNTNLDIAIGPPGIMTALYDARISVVPEPLTLGLLVIGAAALRRRV